MAGGEVAALGLYSQDHEVGAEGVGQHGGVRVRGVAQSEPVGRGERRRLAQRLRKRPRPAPDPRRERDGDDPARPVPDERDHPAPVLHDRRRAPGDLAAQQPGPVEQRRRRRAPRRHADGPRGALAPARGGRGGEPGPRLRAEHAARRLVETCEPPRPGRRRQLAADVGGPVGHDLVGPGGEGGEGQRVAAPDLDDHEPAEGVVVAERADGLGHGRPRRASGRLQADLHEAGVDERVEVAAPPAREVGGEDAGRREHGAVAEPARERDPERRAVGRPVPERRRAGAERRPGRLDADGPGRLGDGLPRHVGEGGAVGGPVRERGRERRRPVDPEPERAARLGGDEDRDRRPALPRADGVEVAPEVPLGDDDAADAPGARERRRVGPVGADGEELAHLGLGRQRVEPGDRPALGPGPQRDRRAGRGGVSGGGGDHAPQRGGEDRDGGHDVEDRGHGRSGAGGALHRAGS